MPLYREDLDRSGCDVANCGHDHSELFLSGVCHVGAPVKVKYVKQTGQIQFTCGVCERPVAQVKVASRKEVN